MFVNLHSKALFRETILRYPSSRQPHFPSQRTCLVIHSREIKFDLVPFSPNTSHSLLAARITLHSESSLSLRVPPRVMEVDTMENVVDDAAFARELHRQFNAYGNRRSSGRTASKPSPAAPPQPPARKAPAKKTPANTRPVRSQPSKKASESESSPDSAAPKRGRPAMTSTAIKKTAQAQRKSIPRKASTPSQPNARTTKTPEPDVAMQDADNAVVAPSPASSESSKASSSNASSYKPQSSASSRPSLEPIEGHVVDEAEKNDLLESAGVANNQVTTF